VLLVALGLLSPQEALTGVAKGSDVCLFLFGMMLLAEIAREEGLFAWLAAVATIRARVNHCTINPYERWTYVCCSSNYRHRKRPYRMSKRADSVEKVGNDGSM
jgi:Na+/H+ antiporter NhaD/arsenite permease-like protein